VTSFQVSRFPATTAVSLPLILLLLDYWPLRRTTGVWRLVKEKAPLIAMAVVVVFLTIYGQARSGSMSHLAGVPFPIRLENSAVSLARYVGKALWPVDLSCFYGYDKHPAAILVFAAAGLFGVITALAVLQRRRRPWLLMGWSWFLIALLPNIGLLQPPTKLGGQAIDRRPIHIPGHDGRRRSSRFFRVRVGRRERFSTQGGHDVHVCDPGGVDRLDMAANRVLARQRSPV
jgi:hypothetical protein